MLRKLATRGAASVCVRCFVGSVHCSSIENKPSCTLCFLALKKQVSKAYFELRNHFSACFLKEPSDMIHKRSHSLNPTRKKGERRHQPKSLNYLSKNATVEFNKSITRNSCAFGNVIIQILVNVL